MFYREPLHDEQASNILKNYLLKHMIYGSWSLII